MAQISNIKLKNILESGRFDSDYYKPEYLKLLKITSNKNLFTTFEKLNLSVDASAFYPSIEPLYNTGNLPFIRVANVDEKINYKSAVTIPKKILTEYNTIKLARERDILITKGGSVARLGYVTKECALSRDLIYLNSSTLEPFDSKYIYFYFLCNFSNKLLLRSASLTAQPHLTIKLVREIPIFYPKIEFRKKIANLFDLFMENEKKSKSLYKECEEILIKELGLIDYRVDHNLTFESTKKSIEEAERFDSDYFQPKYDKIIKKIENYEEGWDFADNLFIFNNENFYPDKDKYYNYVPLSKVSNSGEIEISEKILGKDLPTRARRLVETGEVIVSSIKGSLETSAIIREEHKNFICSNGFYIFKSEKINPEALLVLFKSKIMIKLLEKSSKGTILGGYTKEELGKIKIPLIKKSIQEKIADKLKKTYELRRESKEIIEKTKKIIEEEIENQSLKPK
jgi:restriction endonuclease S subunit